MPSRFRFTGKYWAILAALALLMLMPLSGTFDIMEDNFPSGLAQAILLVIGFGFGVGLPTAWAISELRRQPEPVSLKQGAKFRAFREARWEFTQKTDDPFLKSLQKAAGDAIYEALHTEPAVEAASNLMWRKYWPRVLASAVTAAFILWVLFEGAIYAGYKNIACATNPGYDVAWDECQWSSNIDAASNMNGFRVTLENKAAEIAKRSLRGRPLPPIRFNPEAHLLASEVCGVKNYSQLDNFGKSKALVDCGISQCIAVNSPSQLKWLHKGWASEVRTRCARGELPLN